MSWTIKGSYFENCSCDVFCPCNSTSLQLPGDGERCHAFVAFHIDEGEADGVDLSGLNAAIFLDAPAQMIEGGWSYGVVVDEAASEDQAEKLAGIFAGRIGGPLADLSGLIANDLGVERAPIEFSEEGRRHRIRIGTATEVEVEDYHAEGQAEPTRVTNVNIPFNSTLTVAVGTTSRINLFGYEVSNEGKSAASAPLDWSG